MTTKTPQLVRPRSPRDLRAHSVSMRWSPEALEAREDAREEERQRLARELHDELGQALTGMKLELSWIEHHLTTDSTAALQIKERVQVLRHLVERATRTTKSVVTELRPEALDRLGLVPALEWQAETFSRQAGLRCRFHARQDSIDLDRGRATAVFRVFQELLTNIARHAAASRVDVTVELQGDVLVLLVRDNGKGFDIGHSLPSSAFGLLGIRERALLLGGEFEVSSVPRRGTTAVLRIPLANRRAIARNASGRS
jgi:signal transduction histidine kinase